MRKIQFFGENIIVTKSRRLDERGFQKAVELIVKANQEILQIERESTILFQDKERNSVVIERLNTDTFTLQVQFEINCQKVYRI